MQKKITTLHELQKYASSNPPVSDIDPGSSRWQNQVRQEMLWNLLFIFKMRMRCSILVSPVMPHWTNKGSFCIWSNHLREFHLWYRLSLWKCFPGTFLPFGFDLYTYSTLSVMTRRQDLHLMMMDVPKTI